MRSKTRTGSKADAAAFRQRRLCLAVVAPAVLLFGAATFAVEPYKPGEAGSTSHPTVESVGGSEGGGSASTTIPSRVEQLWVTNGELRFILDGCDRYYKIAANDVDTPTAYDMLLAALLSRGKVNVYSANLAAFTACPTANTMAGSVRVQP